MHIRMTMIAVCALALAACPADRGSARRDGPDRRRAAQTAKTKARYAARRPKEMLEFFGVVPGMTVVDTLPGDVWYAGLLLDTPPRVWLRRPDTQVPPAVCFVSRATFVVSPIFFMYPSLSWLSASLSAPMALAAPPSLHRPARLGFWTPAKRPDC